jgi:hypothetical protein
MDKQKGKGKTNIKSKEAEKTKPKTKPKTKTKPKEKPKEKVKLEKLKQEFKNEIENEEKKVELEPSSNVGTEDTGITEDDKTENTGTTDEDDLLLKKLQEDLKKTKRVPINQNQKEKIKKLNDQKKRKRDEIQYSVERKIGTGGIALWGNFVSGKKIGSMEIISFQVTEDSIKAAIEKMKTTGSYGVGYSNHKKCILGEKTIRLPSYDKIMTSESHKLLMNHIKPINPYDIITLAVPSSFSTEKNIGDAITFANVLWTNTTKGNNVGNYYLNGGLYEVTSNTEMFDLVPQNIQTDIRELVKILIKSQSNGCIEPFSGFRQKEGYERTYIAASGPWVKTKYPDLYEKSLSNIIDEEYQILMNDNELALKCRSDKTKIMNKISELSPAFYKPLLQFTKDSFVFNINENGEVDEKIGHWCKHRFIAYSYSLLECGITDPQKFVGIFGGNIIPFIFTYTYNPGKETKNDNGNEKEKDKEVPNKPKIDERYRNVVYNPNPEGRKYYLEDHCTIEYMKFDLDAMFSLPISPKQALCHLELENDELKRYDKWLFAQYNKPKVTWVQPMDFKKTKDYVAPDLDEILKRDVIIVYSRYHTSNIFNSNPEEVDLPNIQRNGNFRNLSEYKGNIKEYLTNWDLFLVSGENNVSMNKMNIYARGGDMDDTETSMAEIMKREIIPEKVDDIIERRGPFTTKMHDITIWARKKNIVVADNPYNVIPDFTLSDTTQTVTNNTITNNTTTTNNSNSNTIINNNNNISNGNNNSNNIQSPPLESKGDNTIKDEKNILIKNKKFK